LFVSLLNRYRYSAIVHHEPYTKIHSKGKVLRAVNARLIYHRFGVKRVTRSNRETTVTEEDAAKTIFNGLKAAGINLVATLPDINLAHLLHDVIHVPLCREEEGIGICAGAYLVGKKCAAIMQNGGFFNSNNAIVTTLLQYQIPLLLLIYYAGDIGDRTFSTSGSMTEPVLQALGIRHYIMREPGDAPELIKRAQILAEDSRRPVALLLTKELLGRRASLKSL
jgi:sulfopyruvate decarboxylase subunit alpha